MLDHIEIYVSDIEKSFQFWSSIMQKIGYDVASRWESGFTIANDKDAYLTFVKVEEKHRERGYHRCDVGLNHLAFQVASRGVVDELKMHCAQNHVSILYDDRYPYANGDENYYALFVEDPDRIKVEFVSAE